MRTSVYALTFADKERFLTVFSPGLTRIIAGAISGLVVFLGIYFSIELLGIIEFNLGVFLGHLIATVFISILASYLKLLEYKLEMISYKESNIHDIIPNFLYVFLLALIILYSIGYYVVTVPDPDLSSASITNLIILTLIISIFLSYMLSALWTFLYVLILDYVGNVDWVAKFDEDTFYRVLPLKFYESKRYHTPLSLGVVEFKNYDVVLKKFGRKKLQKLMIELVDEINNSLRLVDLVSRIDEGRKLTVIMNIPPASAPVPMQRISSIVKEFNDKHSLGLEFDVSLKVFTPDMMTEFDLIKSEGQKIES